MQAHPARHRLASTPAHHRQWPEEILLERRGARFKAGVAKRFFVNGVNCLKKAGMAWLRYSD